MIWLELRCSPSDRRADLAWLAELTGALAEICDFLLRAAIVAELEADASVADADLNTVVDGRAAEIGSPLVRLREDSTMIELAQVVVSGTVPVQVLAWLALLFRRGPELAGWPGKLTAQWYGSGPKPRGRAKRSIGCRRTRSSRSSGPPTNSRQGGVDTHRVRPRRESGGRPGKRVARRQISPQASACPPLSPRRIDPGRDELTLLIMSASSPGPS